MTEKENNFYEAPDNTCSIIAVVRVNIHDQN